MKESIYQYSRYFAASLLVHGILLVFLLFSIESRPHANVGAHKPTEIVQAVVIDESKVKEEVERLQTREQQQKMFNEAQQKAFVQKLEVVKRERELEQAKLQKLKQDMAKAKEEEQARLAEMKLIKEREKKQLEDLKQEKEKEKKRLAALDDQRQAEQDRVKQLRIEREKEEKKRLAGEKKQQEVKEKAAEAKRLAMAKSAKEAERIAAEKNAWAASEAQRIADAWGQDVKRNKLPAIAIPSEATCILGVNTLPDGSIRVNVVKSSGYPVYDDLSIKAAYKTQPFPLPEDTLLREQLKYFELHMTNGEDMG